MSLSPQEIRKEEQDLLNAVLLNRQEPVMRSLFKLLELRVRKLQDRLLTCQIDEFLATQSEARVLQRLCAELGKPVSDVK